jgi:phosphopantothenoylcysteine decarboxylase/phosphopantothenate--cysteine ligase
MWKCGKNAATQRNVATLRQDGLQPLGPAAGAQACGETGYGRMLEPEELLEEMIAAFTPKSLSGKHLLITAGPTFEPIDPVRGITNLSSGKMGYAIAEAACAGAHVTLISGPVAMSAHGVHRISVQTAQQMHDAVMAALLTQRQDAFIAVAAVADWRVANASDQKLKKRSGDLPQLEFAQNPDILASVAAMADAPYCVDLRPNPNSYWNMVLPSALRKTCLYW